LVLLCLVKFLEEKNDVIGIVEANISNTFGLIKDRKMSGQEFKDMVREG